MRALVLEHFRNPRNRGPLAAPDVSVEGANPLCGDRIRIELRIVDGDIIQAGFTADACALCIASASLLTERIHSMSVDTAQHLPDTLIDELLTGGIPAARARCALLPLHTLRRALERSPV